MTEAFFVQPRTVTVGIPAYNEEENIAHVLKSILAQVETSFTLERVIVLSDGSNDVTDEIVRRFAREHPRVELIADGRRCGKAERLNQLRAANTSDIVINFDADIILSSYEVIERMVREFADEQVALVVGNNQPLEGRNFVEKITNASDYLWYEVRKDFNGGDNIYNSTGCAAALSRSFALSFRYPPATVADQQYVYLMAKHHGKKIVLARNALVLYRSPSNMRDFFKQASRSLVEKKFIARYFDVSYQGLYTIPWSHKLRAIVRRLARSPWYTFLALGCQLLLRLYAKRQSAFSKDGTWDTVASTKKIFH